jgi:hypothetical protein
MTSFWQAGTRAAQRGIREGQRRTTTATPPAPERATTEPQRTGTEAPPERQAGAELPLENYDSLTVQQISETLDDLSVEELRQLRAYEAENKNRRTLLQRLDERTET